MFKPTFPNYYGELPACLHLLNPRHYLLLAYWLLFRPTALKCYLYRADPQLYRATGWRALQDSIRVPAYAVLLPMTVVLMVALVLLISVVQGTPIDWRIRALGLAVGLAVGLTGGLAVGLAFGLAGGLAGGLAFGLAFGLAGGLAFGLVVGLASGLAGGLASGLAFSLAVGLGTTRLFLLPIHLVAVLAARRRPHLHPALWDELVVIPMPDLRRLLLQALRRDESPGLRMLAELCRNPFQRRPALAALAVYLCEHPDPLRFLARIIAHPDLAAYLSAPLGEEWRWERTPPSLLVVLAGLAGRHIESLDRDRWVWRLMGRRWPLPDHALTRLAGSLALLLEAARASEAQAAAELLTESFQSAQGWRTTIEHYPGGAALVSGLAALEACLRAGTLPEVRATGAALRAAVQLTPTDPPLFAATLAALERFAGIAAELDTFFAATSRTNRQAALLRANDQLQELETFTTQMPALEQPLLQAIIVRWRGLIAETGGAVAQERELRPVRNPYMPTNPVAGRLFVGREEPLHRLEALWGQTARQAPSVVLYGHRRMGKSSILQNLNAARFGVGTVLVAFDMQTFGGAGSDGELLLNLAQEIVGACARAGIGGLPAPDEAAFQQPNPGVSFVRTLAQLDPLMAQRRLIVTVDEFEILEQGINEGRLTPRLLEIWRSAFQRYPWFVLAFAGLHTLQEMHHNYWNPLFASVEAIKIGFLSPAALRNLITEPDEDFPLDYDEAVIQEITRLTGGQPALTQRICADLVNRYNDQMFEQRITRAPRLTLDDLQAVLEHPEFDLRAAYFSGVWAQAARYGPAQVLLRALAQDTAGATAGELAARSGLPLNDVQETLALLQRHDMIIRTGEHYAFAVPLMQRYVQRLDESAV